MCVCVCHANITSRGIRRKTKPTKPTMTRRLGREPHAATARQETSPARPPAPHPHLCSCRNEVGSCPPGGCADRWDRMAPAAGAQTFRLVPSLWHEAEMRRVEGLDSPAWTRDDGFVTWIKNGKRLMNEPVESVCTNVRRQYAPRESSQNRFCTSTMAASSRMFFCSTPLSTVSCLGSSGYDSGKLRASCTDTQ